MQTLAPLPALDWCVFLDVDGTLIELSDSPFEVRASPALKTTLQHAAAGLNGALALVSGRSIDFLDALFAPVRLPCAGLHGVERRAASGIVEGARFHDARLDAAREALGKLVQTHPGTLLEDKGRTLGVHYRMGPQFEAPVSATVAAVAAALGADFHVQAGNMMFEIKPRGCTKGGAIEAFMREAPFAGRKPVFVGDDLTDLDGFAAVERLGGWSVGVGSRVKGQWQLDDPVAVRDWLAGVAALGVRTTAG